MFADGGRKTLKAVQKKLNDEFIYSFRDDHRCQIKLTEVIRDKKVVWYVMDNYFGLVPEFERYEVCFNAWTGFITDSLRNLITTGKGQPNPKEERTV